MSDSETGSSGRPTGETYDLSPDWEYLADELADRGHYQLAAKAREEDLTPGEVYGHVVPLIEEDSR